jgi:hypothetical protein
MTRPCKWGDGILGSVCMSGSLQPDLPVWRTVGLPHLTNWPPISDSGAISKVAGPQATSIAAYRGGCSGDGLVRLGKIRFSWSGIESSLEYEVLDQLAFCVWNSPVLLLFWISLREFSASTYNAGLLDWGGVFPVLGSGEPCFDGAASCVGLIRGITRSQY